MRVLGLDPGSHRLGYGCIDVDGPGLTYVEAGVLTAPDDAPVAVRLAEIGGDLEEIVRDLRPDAVALEHGFVAVIKGKLQQGALISSEARGVARYIAARAGKPVAEYAPATIKKTVTGRGDADKPMVARFVRRLLGMRREAEPDAADALAIAVTHALLSPVQERIDQAAAGAA